MSGRLNSLKTVCIYRILLRRERNWKIRPNLLVVWIYSKSIINTLFRKSRIRCCRKTGPRRWKWL